jgi:catechol 2,3-dioxygenase-like lactoylglutathione lyase family enzyme
MTQSVKKPLLGTDDINQVCFVVKDIEKAALSWAKLLGDVVPEPFVTAPMKFTQVKYYGELSPFRNKLAFFNTPGVQIELVEPDTVPNLMLECLEKNGEGYNHFAVDVDSIAETLETMEEKYNVAQSGEFYPDSGRYAFLDTREKYKTLIEMLEFGEPKTGEPLSPATGDDQYEGKPLLGTNKIAQLCFVVKDVEATRDAFCQMLGLEKSTILESPDPEIVKVKFRGQATDAINRFTFINTPRIQIELVEPNLSSPSTWQEHLEKYGESAHHIAFWVESVDEKKALLNELGFPTIQEGLFFDGGGQYAYMDTTSEYGIIIELLELYKK